MNKFYLVLIFWGPEGVTNCSAGFARDVSGAEACRTIMAEVEKQGVTVPVRFAWAMEDVGIDSWVEGLNDRIATFRLMHAERIGN